MKKRIRDAIRVQVIPDTWGRVNLTEDLEIEIAKQIAASIKRHVDDIESAKVCWTTLDICSFCGAEWEEDPEGPCCCSRAVEEWEAAQAEKVE